MSLANHSPKCVHKIFVKSRHYGYIKGCDSNFEGTFLKFLKKVATNETTTLH